MEGKQEFSKHTSGHSPHWVKSLEQAGMAMAESLSSIVSTVEAITQSVSRFFDTVKAQKNTVVEFGHNAGERIRPVTRTGIKALNKSRDLGGRLVAKSRENPMPFVLGGIAIVGGIALLAYYLNQEDPPATEGEREAVAA